MLLFCDRVSRPYLTVKIMTDQDYGGIGVRFVATIIDTIVLVVIGYLLAMLTGMTTPSGFNLQGGPALLWFLIGLAYFVVLEAEFGWTVGKRAVGVEVRTEEGGSIDYSDSLIRNVLRVVDAFFFYLVGVVFILLSDEQQRLGDRVGDTVVVST